GPGAVLEGSTTAPYTRSEERRVGKEGRSRRFTDDSKSGTATEGSDFAALVQSALQGATGVTLSGATTNPANGAITVTATNTGGVDLTAGAALATFTIATTPDVIVEGPENFSVSLSSSTPVITSSVSTTITDNASLAITLGGPGAVLEGSTTAPYT